MNTYKITATVNDTGREITDRVTEANEAAAKKGFREIYRHAGQFTIVDVELIQDDVPASKQQERDAIAKIRAILETLGPMSYTATALEGCLEIADQNIEYDFGDSMKKRLESAEKDVARLRDQLSESVKDYEAAHAAAHEISDQKDAEIAALRKQIAALQKKVLDGDDLYDCITLAGEMADEHRKQMDEAAESIVKFADNPGSSEFQQAVKDHRNAKDGLAYANALVARLKAAK